MKVGQLRCVGSSNNYPRLDLSVFPNKHNDVNVSGANVDAISHCAVLRSALA